MMIFKQLAAFASKDETRYALKYIKFNAKTKTYVACDGHRLICADAKAVGLPLFETDKYFDPKAVAIGIIAPVDDDVSFPNWQSLVKEKNPQGTITIPSWFKSIKKVKNEFVGVAECVVNPELLAPLAGLTMELTVTGPDSAIRLDGEGLTVIVMPIRPGTKPLARLEVSEL